MCRCMAWMGRWISMSRLFCDARTRSGASNLGGSRWSRPGYFSMTWMNRTMLLLVSQNEFPAGSRKPGPKQLFSGSGEAVQ